MRLRPEIPGAGAGATAAHRAASTPSRPHRTKANRPIASRRSPRPRPPARRKAPSCRSQRQQLLGCKREKVGSISSIRIYFFSGSISHAAKIIRGKINRGHSSAGRLLRSSGASARSLALVKQRRAALGSGSWCMPASPDDHIAAASDHSVTAVGVRGELVLTVSSAVGTTIPVH
jgi:hypothetical protein